MTTRARFVAYATALMLIGAACAPPPSGGGGGAQPDWVTTRIARTADASGSTNWIGAWTNENWFATLEFSSLTGGGGNTALRVHPRSGPGNSDLGTPQVILPSVAPSLAGLVGGDVIGLIGSSAVEFFAESGGTWSSAGTFAIPAGRTVKAMSDEWLVLSPFPTAGVDALVELFPLDTTGAQVVVGAPVLVGPDPDWEPALRSGFGVNAAVEGNVLVVGGQSQPGSGPGGARVFRESGGNWLPVLSVGGAVDDPVIFARSVAVDAVEGAGIDRVAIGGMADAPDPAVITIWADDGNDGPFSVEQVLPAPTGVADVTNGVLFGSGLAIDGDLLATVSRAVNTPSATAGQPDGRGGFVQLFRRTTSWQPEEEVATHLDPLPEGLIDQVPFRMKARGNHVAVEVAAVPVPPPGCPFPCIAFGVEAWSIDRTN